MRKQEFTGWNWEFKLGKLKTIPIPIPNLKPNLNKNITRVTNAINDTCFGCEATLAKRGFSLENFPVGKVAKQLSQSEETKSKVLLKQGFATKSKHEHNEISLLTQSNFVGVIKFK